MNHGLKGLFALAALVCLAKPGLALADDGPFTTFNIKVDNNPVVSDVSPAITAPITKDTVAFRIQNNTGRALYFAEGGEKQYIPVISNATVTAHYAPATQYKLVDEAGETVAFWTLGHIIPRANVTPATAEQFAAWQTGLETIIANQKVTYQEPPAKPEPRYYEKRSSRVSSGSVIRGFW